MKTFSNLSHNLIIIFTNKNKTSVCISRSKLSYLFLSPMKQQLISPWISTMFILFTRCLKSRLACYSLIHCVNIFVGFLEAMRRRSSMQSLTELSKRQHYPFFMLFTLHYVLRLGSRNFASEFACCFFYGILEEKEWMRKAKILREHFHNVILKWCKRRNKP